MDSWRGFDLRGEVAARTRHPVLMQNDATSACGAELIFGVGASYPDFIYFYIGSFIGGGIVLNSSLFSGRTGTAGAVGPLQVSDKNGKPQQLLKIASIFVLENLLRERGIDPKPLWYSADEWIDFGEPLETLDPADSRGPRPGDRLCRLDHRFQRGRHRRRFSGLGARAYRCGHPQGRRRA